MRGCDKREIKFRFLFHLFFFNKFLEVEAKYLDFPKKIEKDLMIY